MTIRAAPSPAIAPAPTSRAATNAPVRAGAALSDDVFAAIRRHMMLHCCKWDPQVEDVATLARFPLLIGEQTWQELRRMAELLAAELMAMEAALLHRPGLHRRLALPRRVRHALHSSRGMRVPPAPVRVLRFDFHWTSDGWRISEVNSDVPGGYAESGALPRLIADHVRGTVPTGDPAAVWVDAVDGAVGVGAHVALLSAAGFMEDHQVVAYLARRLNERGIVTHLTDPTRLVWRDGLAFAIDDSTQPVDLIVRFYQAEWLATLPRRCGWTQLFAGSRTPVINAATSILTESKRLPLVWDDIDVPTSTWRRLLSETRDPPDVPWRRDDDWLLKTAFCNTGDSVTARSLVTPRQWRRRSLDVLLHPSHWIAQRRFHTLPIDTPAGPMHPCLGVYTVNGRACGIYGRLSSGPVIDYRAVDVAVLIHRDDDDVPTNEGAR